jgi:hypothetical protein
VFHFTVSCTCNFSVYLYTISLELWRGIDLYDNFKTKYQNKCGTTQSLVVKSISALNYKNSQFLCSSVYNYFLLRFFFCDCAAS